ncbi:nucleoside deaminase [Deinococcus sp. KNUC1210]|uniref:nucleoside deaminase n=1 Tax=Deinococcus sp. KNUC1210 TaxID=2917691 RepID=UPI001EEFC2DC|nr:nucleoside deaminase [Deinococcus sp. KNUC1210]ULH16629.1 nucleoside deaminase [Deinococcus sp. KNUC1210]
MSNAVPWDVVMEEAWDAYSAGSLPIGACALDETGEVLSRGRNRLGEAKQVQGIIAGHRMAHAEMNALLCLPDLTAEQSRRLTLVSSVEPCPMCLGAMRMQRISRLAFAARDAWAGHTDALEQTFYYRQKPTTLLRPPPEIEAWCSVLLICSLFESEMPRDHGFFEVHRQQQPQHFAAAQHLHTLGSWQRLRQQHAPFNAARTLLT